MELPFDLSFEKVLIKNLAQDVLSQCQEHAVRRSLEPEYVIEQFQKEFAKAVKKEVR